MADERRTEEGEWRAQDPPNASEAIARAMAAKTATDITVFGSHQQGPMIHMLIGIAEGGDLLASFSVPEGRQIAEQIFERCNHILEEAKRAGKRKKPATDG